MKVWPGVRVRKTFSTKTLKSLRTRACSRRASDDIAISAFFRFPLRIRTAGKFLQKVRQDRFVLSENLVETNPGFRRFPVSIEQREHQLQGYRFVAHGVVGETTQHDFQRRQATCLAVFGD